MDNLVVGKLHHNRCIVLCKEHIALAGLQIGEYVATRTVGTAITVRRARIVEEDMGPIDLMQDVMRSVQALTPEQRNILREAMADRLD